MLLIILVIKLILEILFIKFLLIHQTDSFLIHLRDSVKPLLYQCCIFFFKFHRLYGQFYCTVLTLYKQQRHNGINE